jgi:UPF0716 family protein affecting phage T7 exclusion
MIASQLILTAAFVSGVLFRLPVLITVIVAVLSRSPKRRRNALKALGIMMRIQPRQSKR